MTQNTRPIAELDFDTIKEELIEFFKSNPTFTDYNFEGSALNGIIDVLAYNTHYNAFYANMIHNESFLDTAQSRSSVVSKAKELGYTPKSISASTAYINLNVLGLTNTTDLFTLNRGEVFQSENDNGSFNFIVTKDYVVEKDGSNFTFFNVELKEGVYLNNSFRVDLNINPRSIFRIPNRNIDISTLRVFVRENEISTSRIEFYKVDSVFEIESDSRVYYVQETYDGFYEIYFGDNVLGLKPNTNSIIDVDYIISDNITTANGCRNFSLSSLNSGFFNSVRTITIQPSIGASEIESIDSIKFNAIQFNQSRNRAVAANDYISVLKNRFAFIKSAAAFGGQDADPPVYGKVYISIQPQSGLTITDDIKNNVILPELKKYNVLTILPELIDPEYTYVNLDLSVKFNRNKTVLSDSEIISLLNLKTQQFFTLNLNTFNKDFLESVLISELKQTDPGVSSISITKNISSKIFPIAGIASRNVIRFNNEIVKGSIRSSFFFYNTGSNIIKAFIKDDPTIINEKIDNKGIARYFSPVNLYNVDTGTFITNIGEIEYSNKLTTLSGLLEVTVNVDSFIGESNIVIYANTIDADISTNRNQILLIGTDTRNIDAGVSSGMNIRIETYAK